MVILHLKINLFIAIKPFPSFDIIITQTLYILGIFRTWIKLLEQVLFRSG